MSEPVENNETLPRRKAYSYLRFSTPEQGKGDSRRRQTSMAQSYAVAHRLDLDETLTFHDEGVSGFRGLNAEAGRLAEFREAVRVGLVPPGSVLLVEQLDRISRLVPRKALRVLEDILELGVSVVTLNDGKEYTSRSLDEPIDLLVSLMTFMRANQESEVKSQRLKAAWEHKRATAASRPLTSRVPAWLRLNPETGRIEERPERAELVRRIFDMTLQGAGQHKIAFTFNSERIAPWGDATRKPGLQWHRSYIAKILGNPAVIGIMTPHIQAHTGIKNHRVPQEPLLDYYPAVISHEIWEDAQALLATRGAARGRQASAPVSSILARLAACPKCGRTMLRVQKGKRSQPHLVCSAAKAGAGCEYKSVRYSVLEQRLLQVLPAVIKDREGLEEADEIEARIAELEDGIFAFQSQIEDLVDLIMEERSPALTQRLRSLEHELPGMQAELQILRDHREVMAGPVVGSRIERALAAMTPAEGSELDRAEVNLALRRIFKRAVINWPNGTIDLEWQLGGTCRVHYAWTGGPWHPSNEETLAEQ